MAGEKHASRSKCRMRTYLTVGIVLVLLLLPWARASPASASGNPVGEMAADIASLPSVPGNDCQAVISAVQGGGIVEQDLNNAFGTDFAPLAVNSGECKVLLAFVPVVGSYNDLIVAAQQYNASNPASVRNFYEKAFILAAEVMIVGFALDGTLYKASFQATGEINDGLKLGKLQSICGDVCYADVLSAIYWFINGTAVSALDGFVTWAISNLPASVTSELPRPKSLDPLGSIGALGPGEVTMYSLSLVVMLVSFLLAKRSMERDEEK
jgi:hypothetical protein